MYHFTQKFWRGWSKNWGGGLEPLSPIASAATGGISWAICKSASCSRQITTSAPHHSVFYRPDALPAAQPSVKALKALVAFKLPYKTVKMAAVDLNPTCIFTAT